MLAQGALAISLLPTLLCAVQTCWGEGPFVTFSPVPWSLPSEPQAEELLLTLLAVRRKEILEEVEPPCVSMVPLSTMHQDYRWEGSMSAPPAPTQVRAGLGGGLLAEPAWSVWVQQCCLQGSHPGLRVPEQSCIGTFCFLQPHDYRLEQPQTFWREYAQQLPVSSMCPGSPLSPAQRTCFSGPGASPTPRSEIVPGDDACLPVVWQGKGCPRPQAHFSLSLTLSLGGLP